MKESVARVVNFLTQSDVGFELITLQTSARTATEAAGALGCDVGQIAKSLVFEAEDNELVLVVAAGDNRVDVKRVEAAMGRTLSMCRGNEVKAKVGFAIGGVAPVAHTQSLRIFLDPGLKRYPRIWAAAGTPHCVFSIQPDDLASVSPGAIWLEVAEAG